MFLNNKDAYVNKLFEILNPLLPHYSKGGALLKLGYTGTTYSERIANSEAFIRVLWGLASFFSGGGSKPEFENIYRRGLVNGTDPNSEEYWGEPTSVTDQRLCEMTAIAVGLLLAPDKLWSPLSDTEKNNLARWLSLVNRFELVECNWLFFGVLVNVALKKLNRPEFDQVKLNEDLAGIDNCYEGEGWYRDGVMNTHDYYVSFAFHYYGLIYYSFMRDDDFAVADKFRERALLFGQQFVYWISNTGPAVPYGRSMTYRFAEVAYFSACVYAGIEPIPLQTMKGIIDRNLEYWWNTDMKDFSEILSIGYTYPNLIMAEAYNGPGSPLWALKTFLLLALNDTHPYWSAPADDFIQLDEKKWLRVPEMIVTQHPGNITLYTNGVCPFTIVSGHMEEKYSKFAYSSKFGFSVRKANDCLENMAPDSDLVFKYGGLYYGRNTVTSYTVNESEIVTHWSPLPGIEVTTTITPSPLGHTRHQVIQSSVECEAYDCGFAMPTEAANYTTETDTNTAMIRSTYGSCTIYCHGSTASEGVIISASPNTNLLYPRSAIPAVMHRIPKGTVEFVTNVITL